MCASYSDLLYYCTGPFFFFFFHVRPYSVQVNFYFRSLFMTLISLGLVQVHMKFAGFILFPWLLFFLFFYLFIIIIIFLILTLCIVYVSLLRSVLLLCCWYLAFFVCYLFVVVFVVACLYLAHPYSVQEKPLLQSTIYDYNSSLHTCECMWSCRVYFILFIPCFFCFFFKTVYCVSYLVGQISSIVVLLLLDKFLVCLLFVFGCFFCCCCFCLFLLFFLVVIVCFSFALTRQNGFLVLSTIYEYNLNAYGVAGFFFLHVFD